MSRGQDKRDMGAGQSGPLLQNPQDRALIRVELLRLAHRHDAAAQDIVARAQALEAYVFGDQAADKP